MAYINLNCDILDTLDMMDDGSAGMLIKAILAFKRGEEERQMSYDLMMVYSMLKVMVSDDEKPDAAAIHRECGKRGGRPRKTKKNQNNQNEFGFDGSSSLPPSSPSSPSTSSPCTPISGNPNTPYNPPLTTSTDTGLPSGGGEEQDDGRTRDTVVGYAVDNLLTLSPTNLEELVSFKQDLPDDVICHAVDVALAQGKRNWAYVRAILNRYVTEGLKTIGEIKAQEDKHTAQVARSGTTIKHGSNPALNYTTSDIKDNDLDGIFVDLDALWDERGKTG